MGVVDPVRGATGAGRYARGHLARWAPAGCQQAIAALTRYDKTVGQTWYSKVDAATRAANDIEAAFNYGAMYSGPSETLYSDLSALARDFTFLQQNAIEQNGPGYDTVAAQTNTDRQTLNTDCGTG